jgi:hypothetical protein
VDVTATTLQSNLLIRNESTPNTLLFDSLNLTQPKAGYYQLSFIDSQRLQQPAIASFVVVPGIVLFLYVSYW